MTFFKNFFRKKMKPEIPDNDQEINVETAGLPSFTDEHIGKKRGEFRPVALHDFLNRDHWQAGFNHALNFPSIERRNSAVARICADYRLVLQKALQATQVDAENHGQEIIRMKGLSDVLDLQMERRSRELLRLANALEQQLELSVDQEGWLAPVLAAYRDGFLVGAQKYAQINDLLGGLTSSH